MLLIAELAALNQAIDHRSLKFAQLLRRGVDAHLIGPLPVQHVAAFARDALCFLDPRPLVSVGHVAAPSLRCIACNRLCGWLRLCSRSRIFLYLYLVALLQRTRAQAHAPTC